MKYTIRERLLLAAQVAILLAQVAGLGVVAVGNANDLSGMAVTTERPDTPESVAAYRDEIHARARIAAWSTRFHAMSGLGLMLDYDQASNTRLAGNHDEKSG